ncbi:hypothetical protein ACFQZC_35705 [Streptacidiphilus monticola]
MSSPGRPAYSYRLSAALAPVALVRLLAEGTRLTVSAGTGILAEHRTRALPGDAGWEREIRRLLAEARGGDETPVRRVIVCAPYPVAPEAAGTGAARSTRRTSPMPC